MPINGNNASAINRFRGPCKAALRRAWPTGVVVIVIIVGPWPTTCVGLKLHVVSEGNPEHVKLLTVPLNVPVAPTSICAVWD